MQRNILVIGYYDRENLGDDVFKYCLSHYFDNNWPISTYTFTNIDNINYSHNYNLILFGGGDLINDYFMSKMEPLLRDKSCPIYAIGIGIPYPSLIDRGYLDNFDYIIHRNRVDQKLLKDKYDSRSEWYPDIATLLLDIPRSISMTGNRNTSVKKIGIFLSRHMYNKDDPTNYYKIVDSLSSFIENIANRTTLPTCLRDTQPKYAIYLIPFCTDGKVNHDDRLVNQDIYDRLSNKLDNIYLYNGTLAKECILSTFESFHMTICMRFHAHIFSLLAKVPMLSIYSTRKVENLLTELGSHEYSYPMKLDGNDYPISVDSDELISVFDYIETNRDSYVSKLDNLYSIYNDHKNKFIGTLDNLIYYLPKWYGVDDIESLAISKVDRIGKLLEIDNPYDNGSVTQSSVDPKYIADIISYELTQDRKSIYHYGLSTQVLTPEYNLYESVKWILSDMIDNNSLNHNMINSNIPMEYRKFNMTYVNNRAFAGYHRAGWSYVVDNMFKLHNPTGIIFDSYLDKTFGWDYEFFRTNQTIPYKSDWVGVLHHTANTTYSDNNLVTLFEKQGFIDSLKFCKGLIVLSHNNYQYVNNRLMGHNIPILHIKHPTDFDVISFNYDMFEMNPAKKIIQIGAWLRNTYAIYELPPINGYTKTALKGKDMDNYYIPNINQVISRIKEVGSSQRRNSISLSDNSYTNKYVAGLSQLIVDNHESVMLLSDIDNDQYDELLKCNIVFINLVDAAAVNTILECIARNTPILVNRLPATEEYLGCDYPLFYNDISEVPSLLTNINVRSAYNYLSQLDKSDLMIDHFISKILEYIKGK